jgi:LPPG:FO 2-phospho-L-lactate transferase
MSAAGSVVAFSGGVGGAKLALGLDQCLGERLLVACNTGDDFEHLGLTIAPDFDTVLYTLAGLANPELGWGRADESWGFLDTLGKLGGDAWFRLGDRDLALHVLRTQLLRDGVSPGMIADRLRTAFGIAARIQPATEDRLRTIVETDVGTLPFQDYFVRLRCAPKVLSIRFEGAEIARPAPALEAEFSRQVPAAYVICPSNPYLSVAPMLAVDGIRQALLHRSAPCVAVSPIVHGQAIKGPTAKIMAEIGVEPSALEVARLWADLIDILVLDSSDANLAPAVEALGVGVVIADTIMRTTADKVALARVVLGAAGVTA